MQLQNTFKVPVPVDEAWRIMLDVEQIAPCMPGATVDQVVGDDVEGRVKVKLGPIVVTYRGKLTFAERDQAAHRVTMNAAAREVRGSGTASARVEATMRDVGDATEVVVTTDLNITGKPAQFGRNVMADVSARIIDEFAANLARQLEAGTSESVGDDVTAVPAAERPSAESLDLLGAAGAPVLKRLAPAALLAVAAVVLLVRRSIRAR